MNVLDLFSGIGGFSLGLEAAGFQTAAFCEFDKEAQKVLKKNWPDVPIFDDIKTLTKEVLDEQGITDIGLICGGYPCQPFSIAGERRGAEDDRHLWPEMFRIIQELRPTWVIGENVAGHINMGLDEVLSDLESANYTARTFVIPAVAVDASHRRDRVWIVAHSKGLRTRRHPDSGELPISYKGGSGMEEGWVTDVANTMHQGLQGRQETGDTESSGKERKELPTGRGERSEPGNWLPEPPVGRVANGVPRRSHRLKQLGNAVVPRVVEMIGRSIMTTEMNHENL